MGSTFSPWEFDAFLSLDGRGEGEGVEYFINYTFYVLHNIGVPEPDHSISSAFQIFCPDTIILILSRLSMLTTVYFYDESLFEADKINNIVSNRLLSSELYSVKLRMP